MKQKLFFSLLFLVAAVVVFAGELGVMQPAGGETWPIGSTQFIKWVFVGGEGAQAVNLILIKDGALIGKIAENIPYDELSGEGHFKWQVGTLLPDNKYVLSPPKKLAPGKGYSIGVKSLDRIYRAESKGFMISE